MSIKIVIFSIVGLIALGVLNYFINKLLYKKSIVFILIGILTPPILVCTIIGFVVGFLGISHLIWGVPFALICIAVANHLVAANTQKPLEKMLSQVDELSQGNVDIQFDEKSQKGEDEIAKLYRRLSKLTTSLKRIALFADNIGKGNLEAEYHLLGEKDNLGMAILDMRSSLAASEEEKKLRQAEDDMRNWATVGLTKFAEILRQNNDNLAELSHDILNNLLKYINANQGGIFILNDDDPEHPVLELQACYAFERRKFLQKAIQPGEGLVGTCFLERESIYITKVPKDYIHITSGLGDDPPRALFITPLKVNDHIYGIIEIAAFREFEPHVRAFVEKVAESIASTVSSVKINIRTNALLEVSKIQAEEMSSQEEELRQNMEEMLATQEEMRRRESELHDTLNQMGEMRQKSSVKENEMNRLYDAIVDSFDVVEFSADGHIVNVNQNVINSHVNATKETFLGKTLADVTRESPEVIEGIFDNLRKGIPQELIQEIIINGHGTKFNNKLVPMIDSNGKLYKVILFAYRTI